VTFKYRLISGETGMKAWPYKIYMEEIKPPDAKWYQQELDADVMQGIHDWLNSNNIRYEYGMGRKWYLKDEIDMLAFKLKWS
jgi:hypothetical protein